MIYITKGSRANTVVTENHLYLGANRLIIISKNPSFKSGRFSVTKGDSTKTLHIPISYTGP